MSARPKTYIPSNFGPTMRTTRRGTLSGLASKLYVSAGYLCRIELGQEPPPGDETLTRWAKITGLSQDEIFWLAGKLPLDCRKHVHKHTKEITLQIRQTAKLLGW